MTIAMVKRLIKYPAPPSHVKGRMFGPVKRTAGARRYRSEDPFINWLYRDPRRAASLSVLFTVGSILVWLVMVVVVLVYLAILIF